VLDANDGLYCWNETCGTAMLESGWSLLAEFGRPTPTPFTSSYTTAGVHFFTVPSGVSMISAMLWGEYSTGVTLRDRLLY
jgi:hypothetical protein